jgi:hypothetical protein
MKRLASLVALALLVPFAAPASASEGSGSAHAKTEKSAPKHPLGKKIEKKHPGKQGRVEKDKPEGHESRAQKRGDDLEHGEPKVTHGVLVTKASARHVEHGSGAKAGRKELPLLPASATEKLDKKDFGGDAEKKPVAKKGHDSKPEANAKKAHESKSDKAEKPEPKKDAKSDKAEDKHEKPEGKKGELKKSPSHEAEKHGANAKGKKADAGHAAAQPKVACLSAPVEIVRGAEVDKFALERCEGGLAPFALERLSVILRPSQVARPVFDTKSTGKLESLSKAKSAKAETKAEKDVLPSTIKRVDPGLVERLDLIAAHFRKPNQTAPLRVNVVSGYRPNSVGSQHSHGRAMDIRLDGVENEELVAFCKSIPDTGCGYYPNSSFVHVDVRDPGAGHVSWIDASGPGESPRYVTEWPLKAEKTEAAKTDSEPSKAEAPASSQGDDEHPAHPSSAPVKAQEMIDGVKD